ncbi:10062_t:CDS:2 [Funneliformis mosseae]|uniref:10062_t:CDS:1 n=1 Tax=Funneliformis mosseae TaxID=27381 RepID=A0A9N9H3C4_FUNMO|nr:10062_t:CDS:2 [Funneliformis mosseae]
MAHERFAYNLAIILARDKKVVAVDEEYIDRITKYLKVMLNNAPTILEDTEYAFTNNVMIYCSGKLRKRLEKFKKNIKNNSSDKHIETFQKYYSTKEIKNDTIIHPKFLGHIKKVMSYTRSLVDIIEYAYNISYKGLFANIIMYKRKSDVINQLIYSLKILSKDSLAMMMTIIVS